MAESSSADSCGLGGSARPTTRQAGGSKSREPSPRFSSGLQRHTTTISRKRAGRASRRRCSSRRRWSPTGSPACSRERWGRFRYTREYGPDGYGCGRQEARRWWGAIQGQKPVGIRQRRCLWRPATPGADPGRTEVLAAVWSPAQSVRGLQGRPRRSCVRSPRRRRSRARPHHGRSPCRQGAGWPRAFLQLPGVGTEAVSNLGSRDQRRRGAGSPGGSDSFRLLLGSATKAVAHGVVAEEPLVPPSDFCLYDSDAASPPLSSNGILNVGTYGLFLAFGYRLFWIAIAWASPLACGRPRRAIAPSA